MFSDTISITVNAVAKVLTRINQDGYSSEYFLRETTAEYRLRLRNTSYVDKTREKRVDRHNVEFTQTIYPVAPAIVSTIRKVYNVFEIDQGDVIADGVHHAVGLMAFSTNANLTKLANWES